MFDSFLCVFCAGVLVCSVQPVSLELRLGSVARFSCAVGGSPADISWEINQRSLPQDSDRCAVNHELFITIKAWFKCCLKVKFTSYYCLTALINMLNSICLFQNHCFAKWSPADSQCDNEGCWEISLRRYKRSQSSDEPRGRADPHPRFVLEWSFQRSKR